jgi:hypothetical protein
MTGLLLLMMFSGALFAPFKVYEGTWTVVSAHTMAKADRIRSSITAMREQRFTHASKW